MGTRATFWIGDPRDLERRQWLGATNFDGYCDSYPLFDAVETEEDFRFAVRHHHENSEFIQPGSGWPWPWDVFSSDFTYAFFDGDVWVSLFRSSFQRFAVEMVWPDANDPTMMSVPTPEVYNRALPDGFIHISMGGIR